MTSVREQLEEQRDAMAPEIQALLDVSDEGIGHVVEFSARWCIALRAVLDIHYPVSQNVFAAFPLDDPVDVCSHCNTSQYPCATAAAIESALTTKDAQ